MEYIIYNTTLYYFHITSYCLSVFKASELQPLESKAEPNPLVWLLNLSKVNGI